MNRQVGRSRRLWRSLSHILFAEQDEIKRLTSQGILPHEHEMKIVEKEKGEVSPDMMVASQGMLMGQVAGNIEDVKSAQEIVDDMVSGAQQQLLRIAGLVKARR